jgi:hypothetical protein
MVATGRYQVSDSGHYLPTCLNATVILPSFYVVASEPDRLYATYHASYEDGIIESHVVRMARFFAGACVYGARTTMTDEHVLH